VKKEAGLAGRRIGEPHVVPVLEAVHLLQEELGRTLRPLHPGDVVVARIPGQIDPDRSPTRGRHDADLHGGIGRARGGVAVARDDGIGRVGVVDEREDPDARVVEVPERDTRSVGAPPEAVPDVELLFVYPVRGAVDDGIGAVRGQPGDRPRSDVLDPQVVVEHVGHATAVGRELREHQGRLRRRSAEAEEPPGVEVEDPVIASCLQPPDLLRVGEEKQMPAVFRPGVVVDRQRLSARGRDETGGGDEDATLTRRAVVPDDVLRPRCRSRRLHGRERSSLLLPASGAELLRVVVLLREDALELSPEALRKLSGDGRDGQAREESGSEEDRPRGRAARASRTCAQEAKSGVHTPDLTSSFPRHAGSSPRRPPFRPGPAASRSSRWVRGSRARAARAPGRTRPP
jgi:hypothetical protein